MIWVRSVVVLVLALVGGGHSAACSVASVPSPDVDRLEVHVRVEENGTVQVDEVARVRFSRGDQVYVRDIDGAWADGFTFVAATLDGAALTPDRPRALTVRDGPSLRVRIAADAGAAGAHDIGVRYRITRAVAIEGAHGVLTLPVLHGERGVAYGQTTITLDLPIGVEPLDGSGMAEAGWAITRRAQGLAASKESVQPHEAATLMARFEVQRGQVPEPQWQMDREQAQRLAPAFVSGGLFILVIGAGVLWILRFQFPARVRATALAERADARRGLLITGLASIGLAAVTSLAVRSWLDHLGPWPMSLPVSIALVGLVFLLVHRRWV
jgi:hypothetical protein